jgi:SAM-dependent methyltransferase
MNRIHRWYCRSAAWRSRVETDLLPWALKDAALRGPALEIGPGPGITTDYLHRLLPELTVLEFDDRLAAALRRRFRDTHVRVIQGDATSMPFSDGSCNTVLCFTMLHHIPSPSLQNRLLAEAFRVLAPGGAFLGVDSRLSLRMKLFHWFDTMMIVDPQTFTERLRTVGFDQIQVELSDRSFRFRAVRPV